MKTQEMSARGDPWSCASWSNAHIRVDQAGEFGAVRIYQGQFSALVPDRPVPTARPAARIAAMARAEREHGKEFDRLLVERRVRPTALQPLVERRVLRARCGDGADGRQGAAMACTVAAEETIDEHYAHQAAALGDRRS